MGFVILSTVALSSASPQFGGLTRPGPINSLLRSVHARFSSRPGLSSHFKRDLKSYLSARCEIGFAAFKIASQVLAIRTGPNCAAMASIAPGAVAYDAAD